MAEGLVPTEEFQDALQMLHEGRDLFITGKAGTGKTTLTRHFLESTDKNVLVMAPTGIAALNLGGYTIHHVFSFVPTTTLDEVRTGRYYPGRFAAALKNVDTLVIDEASMVRADLFDMVAAALTRFGPYPGKPFGGVQIVLVGDLHQLAPVVPTREESFFRDVYEGPYFFSAEAFSPDRFATVHLTTVFRQQGDPRMIEILNDIRTGTLRGEQLAELNQRVDTEFEPPEGEFWLTLAATNRIAGARNKERLQALETPECRHTASATGDLDGFERPVEDELVFKVGAQVMLVTNDSRRRWFNGSLGRLVRWDAASRTAGVELRSGEVVDITPYRWEATRPVVQAGSLRHEVVGTYTQLPFRLAWAITIHKSQGQTVDRLVVDLSGGMFADGQLYVALSRCTSMAGLVLKRPVRPADLRVDPRIRRFTLSSHGTTAPLRPVYLGIRAVGERGFLDYPRPIEIGVVTADGMELQTLVNPGRDIGEASQKWGISALDALLAPTMAEAWDALVPYIAGRVPVGIDIDLNIRRVDAELKRLGHVVPMPIGCDLRPAMGEAQVQRLSEATALEQAKAIHAFVTRSGFNALEGTPFPATRTQQQGFLMHRDDVGHCFAANDDGGSGATLVLSKLSERPDLASIPKAHSVLSHLAAMSGAPLPELPGPATRDVRSILVPGTRICFTGSAVDRRGVPIDREALETLAQERGLVPVANVSKTRCDVLVAAEPASQSGKAKKARQWDKPILGVAQFLDWAAGQSGEPRQSVSTSDGSPSMAAHVVVRSLPPVEAAASTLTEWNTRSTRQDWSIPDALRRHPGRSGRGGDGPLREVVARGLTLGRRISEFIR